MEPLDEVIAWHLNGLAIRLQQRNGKATASIRNEPFYHRLGVAFTTIGNRFAGRAYRFPSIFDTKGRTVFSESVATTVSSMNCARSRFILESLNPGIDFTVGDVNRLPLFPIADAEEIFKVVSAAFTQHEAAREPSVEFRRPGTSPWRYAQQWAQIAVDRPHGSPVPQYEPQNTDPPPSVSVSFSVGVSLGRFHPRGGVVNSQRPPAALPGGILFVSADGNDSLEQPGCECLSVCWAEQSAAVGQGDDIRTFLRKKYFDQHFDAYEGCPIYFPLSSSKKSFVAFVSIHRWADDTLNVLLADHLAPAKRRLDGEMDDLRTARALGNNKGKAERRFTEVQKLLEELNDFIAKVTEIAEKGPPPPDDKTTKREVDARYVMDLDDGVMVNSAALWPLLEPQWKDPKKWWKELANAQGKKDYDWSHLAGRYFPERVKKKCHEDPSLAVAHKCFWELHPDKAYAWELRLQDEIRPDFTIDEPGSDDARAKFLREQKHRAAELTATETKRRERKAAKATGDVDQDQDQDGEAGPLFANGDADEAEASDD